MLLNITIPVFNEEAQLEQSVARILDFAALNLACPLELVIANNASTDRTQKIGEALAGRHSCVSVTTLSQKGRGRAIKAVWKASGADVLAYMDVDLSTDLAALPPLVACVMNGQCDIAVGSRLLKDSVTVRGAKREFISRCYNLLIKAAFRTGFSDAQCGFKAVSRRVVEELLPLVEDDGWFLDTELLILAEKLGYRIQDIPVHWVDDPDSRVRIFETALDDVKGLIRVRRNLKSGRYIICGDDPVRRAAARSGHYK